jgi:glycosyltransferase involved in cell wall biosynthesis
MILIEAVAKLRRQGYSPQVLIVGEGPLRDELMRRISELGMEREILLPGFRDDIPQMLALLDIFVLPSLREGFPMTILEAMAAGLPIIVTDVGGTSEAIKNGRNGIVIPPGNADLLAKALIELLKDKDLARRMGKNAQTDVTQDFSVTNMVRKTETLYLSHYRKLNGLRQLDIRVGMSK